MAEKKMGFIATGKEYEIIHHKAKYIGGAPGVDTRTDINIGFDTCKILDFNDVGVFCEYISGGHWVASHDYLENKKGKKMFIPWNMILYIIEK